MSAEIWVKKEIYICGCAYSSKTDIEGAIEDCKFDIAKLREKLKTMVYMTEPKKFYPDDCDIPLSIDSDFDNIMEEYDRLTRRLTLLHEFFDAWDECHDKEGRCILPVNPTDLHQRVYMGGDYMNYILEDGSEMPDDYWDVLNGFKRLDEYSLLNKIK